jgi:hypothetical protein
VPIANGYELRQGLLDVGVHCEMAVYTGAKPLCVYVLSVKIDPKYAYHAERMDLFLNGLTSPIDA